MILKKIKINKFKNIENLEIDLSKNNIFTILGTNNIGKTNILDAIFFWQELKSKKKIREPKKINIKFIFELGSEEKKQYFNKYLEELIEKTKANILLSPQKTIAEKNWEEIKNFEITAKWNDEANSFSRYYPAIILDSKILHSMIETLVPKINKINIDNIFEGVYLKNKVSKDDHVFKKILWNINKDNFFDEYKKLNKDTISEKESIEKLNKEITSFLFDDQKQYNYKFELQHNSQDSIFEIIIKNIENNKDFYPEEMSEGLAFHILIKKELGTNSNNRNKLILIDEPNTFLHSTAQNEFSKYLKLLGTDNKYLFSTHSEHIIDENFDFIFKEKDLWVQKKPKDKLDYTNIQLKTLFDHIKLKNNPINQIIEKEKDMIRAFEAYKISKYDEGILYLFNIIEKQIKHLIPKDYFKKTVPEKINYIIKDSENWEKIKFNSLTLQQLKERLKNDLKTFDTLSQIRNNLSTAHSNNNDDDDDELNAEIKPIANLFFHSYLSAIQILKFIIENKEK